MLFGAAWRAGIPAVTAAPLGFSSTLHVFAPGGISFDRYFDLHDEQEYLDQVVNFAIGLAPKALHLPYMDLSSVDAKSGRGPSSIIGTQLAASLVAAEAARIILAEAHLYWRRIIFKSIVTDNPCARAICAMATETGRKS